jgi:acyl-coenzyme A thioesterase PaaI-like protein
MQKEAATEAEAAALDWIRRTYANNPIATLLGADPLACDPVAGRITIAFEARPGRLVGEGATVKKGRTVTFMEGRLVDAQGKLLTTGTASGTLMKWPPERKPG